MSDRNFFIGAIITTIGFVGGGTWLLHKARKNSEKDEDEKREKTR